MGKSGKWFRIFSSGKKDKKDKCGGNQNSSSTPSTPISIPSTTPKDKKRWSFRRSSATAPTSKDLPSATAPTSKDLTSATTPTSKDSEPTVSPITAPAASESENEEKKHAMEIAAATAAAKEAALAAAQAAAVVIQLTNERATAIEEAAATKIQAAFRSHLARKALCALRGLVKLQALVRGHLVRKQATATLRCMQALITAQARARAHRIQSVEHEIHRKDQLMHPYNDLERGLEENIKIVEMDSGDSKGGYKNRNSSYSNRTPNGRYSKHEDYQVPPSPSALTDMSPRTFSGRFEDYCYSTAQSSPQPYSKLDSAGLPFAFPPPEYAESLSYDYSLYPNYMANTQSSRAKARSQSAPKQRPAEPFERQPSRRRISVEGRNVPRAVRMQRSSSHVGATAHNYQYPWSIKLDRSTVSLIESECGSTSTVLTNNYCRSVATYDPQGDRY